MWGAQSVKCPAQGCRNNQPRVAGIWGACEQEMRSRKACGAISQNHRRPPTSKSPKQMIRMLNLRKNVSLTDGTFALEQDVPLPPEGRGRDRNHL